jgi:hypothetical protein
MQELRESIDEQAKNEVERMERKWYIGLATNVRDPVSVILRT